MLFIGSRSKMVVRRLLPPFSPALATSDGELKVKINL
jgi:hypothetical protein